MSRKNIENIYSLSPMQQGILFHTLYDSQPGVYLVELAWTLRGKLDPEAFQRAWQEVCDRHAVLRTAFVWERLEKPMQLVRKRVQLTIEQEDLRALPAAERAARVAAFQDELTHRGFDLTRAPLLRLALLRLEDDTHRLIWSSHHLVLDGWSLPLLVREAFTLYEAYAAGREVRLERARPYGDYIAWLSKQDLGKAEAYWRKELAGFAAPTPFRIDRVTAGEDGFEERTLLVPEAEAAVLQAFARQQQITVNTLIVGAWALLLARYSGEEEVVYGNTVSGRSPPVPGIERMVGLFINTLPVRIAVPRDATALAWLKSFQDKLAELRDHEHSPLVQVQGWSELARGVPLFESQVAFENYPSAETLLQGGGGLQVSETHMTSQAHYPLTFNAVSQRTVGLRISYDRRRFERAAVDRMLAHLRALLASLARKPGTNVWELPIVSEDEEQRLLVTWNDTAADYPIETTVHGLFEERVAATPDALALVAGSVRLSYRELDARANRLAHHLKRLGVGPDAVVGLSMDRSADAVIGLLGILKAGGAYVPLEPAYPPQRIAQIRDEARARVVVTRAAFAEAAAGEGVTVVRVDADAAVIAAESDARPDGGAGPGSLVYVLFTSGSTGKPKGVAVEHRNLVNYVRGVAGRLALPEGASYAHVSTFSADLGNTVLFPPLCLGGVLHVIAEALTTDPDGLGAYFLRESIDCLKIVPSHLSALLSGAHPERVIPKKLLVLGGEGSTWDLVDRVAKLSPGTSVMNHYGPTETTVGVITHPVARGERLPGTAIVPLGRPLPNTRIYVLDPTMTPAPLGVPGEVYIGGAGVARGYLGQPELTRERFLPDPFRGPADRMYRTGDRGRYLEDGTLLFLGRIDAQVKIRGYRIELGEIEAALLACPGLREAVVLVHEDQPGDKRLCGYVVPAELPGPSPREIKSFLEQRLPEYMIPPSIVVLAAMPLTPNGKVDRKALGTLEGERHEEEADTYVAPRNPIEEVIAGIWCDVFDKERVGVHDKFADLGGHSLLAIQIIARTREAFQVEVPLRAIFDAPTVAGLAGEVEAAMRDALSMGGAPVPPIGRAPRDRPLLLSFAQERLWFLHQLDPEGAVYNVPSALRIEGKLDIAALERALREIVRRHEVLRTTFEAASGKPVQVVHADAELVLPVVRWPALSAAEREEEAGRETAAEARRPFDLARGPLVRARLLVLGDEEHVLLVTLHHIVSDGWTRGILNRELGTLYRAYQAGKDPDLPELPVQYADYAQWQRGWLSGEALDRQIAYWKRQLEGAPQAIDLPTDKPRPPTQTFRGGQRIRILPAEVAAGLKDLSRQEGVTLYMTLLAALDVLLHRWTGQRDVVVGTSVSNRNRAETERLIGFFINALVLRAEVIDDAPFIDLLQRVRDACLGAYAHQDMPFERLVQELQPEPDPSRAPLFQVIFTMQNAQPPAADLPGLALRGIRTESATVKYDLTFVMGEVEEGGLGVSIEYNSDLFEPATIDRMIGHLATLLEGIARDARRKVSELPMLADDERRKVLVEWNDTTAAYSTDECIHELFEAQADATPDAIAVVSGAARLTFRELDRSANRLAHHLRAKGVGPESVVGLCLSRSVDLVVGLLGVLKAGGAYLPLDPTYPSHRLAELLEGAGARVAVTEDRFAPSLPAHGVSVVRVDGDAGSIAVESDSRVESAVASQNLVYVLFTSGSTGKPKGVAVEHRNLVAYVRGVQSRLALPAGASYAHISTFAADLGNTVLFPPLCLGGTLHVIPEALTTDPAGLGAYFQEHRVDCLKIVPSHLSALLSGAHPERVIPGRLLVLGGEGSSWELIERIEKLAPATRILNHYGPTETTVGVVTHPVEKGARVPNTAIVPLGRPLPNAQIYVLDPAMAPAPIGVPGEVYIGGAGVARGYLGQPELTRERFVPDPFGGRPGARLYKTGDRARWLADGTLTFLGRIDFQVKIRGYRIELGEIEAALSAHAGVKDAVVLAPEDSVGDKRLVAYVVAASPGAVGSDELQRHLEQRLPEYMVPSSFVVLDALPLTPNGKIDRKALAAMGSEQEPGESYVAPRTPVEEVLASIWADVFERERIGVTDRFNELGGHSLLAIQIIARARDAFGAQVPLRAIFEAPTIAGLAERVEAAIREEEGTALPPLGRAPRFGPMPLSFSQERLWFLDQLDPDRTSYNIPARLRLSGQLDPAALERALVEIVRRHEVLRTTFATVGGKPAQVIHDAVDLRLALEDVTGEDAVQEAAAAEMARPFDLAAGPLVRARLLRLSAAEHVLLVTMHHIVSDAWTKGVFYRELAALYEAFRAGRPSPLPELPIQYADFAAWQRSWLVGETLERQLDYWKKQLAGAPSALELPTDRPRPPIFTARGARRRFALSPELSRALQELSRRGGATLFMTTLAAFDALLYRVAGQGDVVVGTPTAGRTRPEIEPLLGFFVNTLALRTKLSPDLSFVELLASVRETCLGAYAHQDIPFERLVADLAPERDLARTPVFQVLFTLQGAAPPVLRLPSLSLSGVAAETTTAKFDLTLALGDGPTGLLGSLEYNTDLYDGATIDRMIEHYRTLLESIVAAPDAPLGELAIMSAAERHQVVAAWNATDFAHPTGACIHEIFEQQAARAPAAIALSFEGRELTYGELNERANRLAHALRGHGVRPDGLVGVCMDRSLDMVVALHAVLKAGGAYVPLDPEYPRDRLAFMLDDARPAVILTQAHLAAVLPEHGARVIRLDTEWASVATEPGDNPPRDGLTLESLAYVIYTSGSTGRPKGAMNAHRGILNRLLWMQRAYGLGTEDRVLQKTPFSFDVSVWELFWPLMFGARLVIARPEGHRDPGYLAELVAGQGITTLHFVPSMLKAFVDEPGARRCRSLRRVICSGEALSPQLADQLFALGLGAELHNLYGPTEAAVDVTAWACEPGASVVPIGRPIDNVRMYVLDERRQPQPIGVPGDLYIGGVQVGRGYLNRPELTAERFTSDPFDGAPEARLYKTGDVARWLPEGVLEYRGRSDFQVKIRGYRVELGEIEAALARHPAVREAVVIAREDAGKERRLVGYLVTAEPAPAVGELRSFLKERLPDHMVPAAFVLLDALPLTASGKVDRRALPAPEGADRPDLGEEFVAPRTDVEAGLAGIWSRVLRLDHVGIHDNFFAVGGDSILSIQIVSLAHAAGIHLTPRQLFQHQTIAELAAVSGAHAAAPAEQGPVTGPVPLTPVQRWWLESRPVEPDHHNQSFFLETSEPLEPAATLAAVAALLEHHDALRLRVVAGASGFEQALAPPGGAVPLTRVDLRDVPDAERTPAIERAAAEAQASLDVAAGPLLRAVLFDLGEGRPGRLLLVVHHLAVDGVSWRILVDDFWTAYAREPAAPVALPHKTTSFKRWAERLVEHAASEEMARESAYWLAGDRGLARRLPVDHELGDNTEASARAVVVSLAADETQALLREVPEAYRTQINDVLLTAFAQALAPWTGASAALVDLEGHGREELFGDLDLTRTVGWFTAVFPVVLEAGSGLGPGEALKAVKEQLRAVPGRGVGYGLLRYLRRGDDVADRLARLPQAEASFNYLGQLDQALSADARFRRARESAGAPHGPRNRRRYLLDVTAGVLDGRLNVRFTYSESRHQRATIEALSGRFLEVLRALVAHCLSPEAGGYTPSDFPRAGLGQGTVDRLAALAGRRGIDDVYPLSPMQQGILFHALYASEPGVYLVQLAWTVAGKLDTSAFVQAWQAVVDRHTALRTAILWDQLDRPVQLVQRHATLPVTERDLRDLGPDEQRRAVERFAEEDRRRGFDLTRPPLLRIALLRLGDESWRFVWSSHHIVLDGWSMPILLNEALQLYEARALGGEARLERARPYGEYVGWLVQQDPARTEAFWRRQLAGFTAPTPLAGEDTRPERGEGRFDERRVRLPDAVSAALATFARKHQLTMSTLVQGAWALLLGRYSGEHDVLFGSTVSGRSAPVPGIDRMVGLFINTLAVRVRQSPEDTALAFLAALQDQQAELRDYEHSALAEVQSLSAVPRGTPLFESLVVFENQPIEESLKKGGGSLALGDARAFERPPYPLTLQSSFRKTLLCRIGFDADRFDGALVERMLGHLATLLEGIAAAPGRRLRELPLLTEAERRKLLVTWNDTAFAHPEGQAIHEIFEARAARTPDAIAVVFEGRELRYGELLERRNRLAHALQKRGVGPDVLVGVCMERSIEMVVALYGVLAAGGAYLPLDPEYPKDRLAFMLDDARPGVILTQAHLAGVLADVPTHGAAVIRLDTDWPSIAAEPATSPGRGGLSMESLAYCIYTSGSTGRPKGALNTHRGIWNRLAWMQHAHGLNETDRVLQKTPFSFDVSVWELFWPLMFGARLVVARPGGHREPGYLVDTIASQGITTLHFVPSMLGVFLDAQGRGDCRALRRVFASGEALSPALAGRFFAALPGVGLHNLYGPTEAAVDVTWWACEPGAAVVPIGRPVHNTRIYLLDENLEPVPEGIRGELYIGGVQVGRGYLNRPELTAERFVHDPFAGGGRRQEGPGDGPPARLYRTGDVARYLPSGAIEYLGRADFQVKIRGYRIELGEIEAGLLGYPAVREAVVVARDEGGDKRLVAYLVCAGGPAGEGGSAAGHPRPTVGELRSFLQQRLPEYMVPAAFVVRGALPLTASGKIDRKALPAPEDADRLAPSLAFVAPTSAVEEELARIWASVLRLPRVGVHDNFFEVGGDSILSIQIVSRAAQASIRITPRQIFEHPTVAALAAVAGTQKVVSAEQGPVTGPVPLTPVERWWLELGVSEASHWNQSTFVEVREPIEAAPMERAVARVFEHHDALRLRLLRGPAGFLQAIAAPGGAAPFRRVDLAAVLAGGRPAAIEEASALAHASLDLAEGPIARVVLFDLGEAGQRLLVVAHHLAVDGVSWRILLEDLWSAYAQERRGQRAELPPKTTSFKRWAERLVEHAHAGTVDREEGYWLGIAEGGIAALPVDHRRGDDDEGSTRSVMVSLTAGETEQLLRDVPDAYRTQINDVLLTALAQAFAAWTGSPGVRVDFEGHGRDELFDDVDVTRTVGWFTTVYPVAIELPREGGPGAAIKSVKEQLRAVPARGIGWGLLRYLREGEPVAERLGRLPRAEVSFNYLGQVDQALPDTAPFRWAREPSGPPRSPRAPRRWLVDVNVRVAAGRLHAWFSYSENRYRAGTLEALAARFAEALRALVAHCLSPEARGLTPSDFQDAGLSQDAIDMLVDMVAEDPS